MQEKIIKSSEDTQYSKDNPARLRSFVRRNGRRTEAQDEARETMWPRFGVEYSEQPLDLAALFARQASTVLEIGFGSGQSLLAAAKANPALNFIGIEAHKPGIGALLLGMQEAGLENIRVLDADAFEVLQHMIPPASLDVVLIFFPDPWQKRKHHRRRLVQPEFLDLLTSRMNSSAELHLATDWQHYADHMLQTLSADQRFINAAGEGQLAERSPYRPVVTKFEGRAVKVGRKISDFCFHYQS